MKKPALSFESGELREFGEVLRGRRTINLFLQTPVPAQLIRNAIDVATWAPNHHVTEPWAFYMLGKQTMVACLDLARKIVTVNKDAKAAEFKVKSWSEKPGWLLVTCKRSAEPILQQEDLAACAAAVQNLMLYLWKAGVGCKWITADITRDPRFFDIVGIDSESELVVGLISYGYPKLTPSQARKPPADVLTELP
ncbi:MAG: nitroreductase [Desulfobulbaceae bacterium]|nr:nitroreductase [Desulfobulbaceae bacterium]